MTLCTSSPAAAAVAAALVLLGHAMLLASAAALWDTDRVASLAHTSRPPSLHADAASEAPAAAAVVVVAAATTTVTVHETTSTTDTDTVTDTVAATSAAPPDSTSAATTTSYAMPSQSCDLLYCNNGTSYCVYWGGYSSYDYSEHYPVPGETRTVVGTCMRASTSTNSFSVVTGSASAAGVARTPGTGSSAT